MNKTLILVLAALVCSQCDHSFNFTYPTLTMGTELITSPDMFSWLYITTPNENETKFTKILYEKGAQDDKVMYEVELNGTWQVLAINEEKLDCAILYNAEDSEINLYSMNDETEQFTVVEELTPYFDENSIEDPASSDVDLDVADECKFFRINSVIYEEVEEGTEVVVEAGEGEGESEDLNLKYQADNSSEGFVSPQYHHSYMVIIDEFELFVYDGEEYFPVISSIFYSENQIWYNEDEGVIVTQSVREFQSDAGPVDEFVLRYFVRLGQNSWREVDLNIDNLYSGDVPSVFVSEDFKIVGVSYVKQFGGNAIIMKHVRDQDTIEAFDSEDIPSEWIVDGQKPHIELSNNKLYYRVTERDSGSNSNPEFEVYYEIDRENNEFEEVGRRDLEQYEIEEFVKTMVSEANGDFLIIIETEDEDEMTVTVEEIDVFALIEEQIRERVEIINTGIFVRDGLAFRCSVGCLSCEDESSCSECARGFVLDSENNECVRCQGLCAACELENTTACLSCFVGSFLTEENECSPCGQNCQECQDDNETCSSCMVGFVLNETVCDACPERCESCTNSTFCDLCQPGYVALNNGTCLQCLTSCTQCNTDRIMTCEVCRDGYELVTSNEGSTPIQLCQVCPRDCKTCEDGVCQVCDEGFRLIASTGRCERRCQFPCSNCEPETPDVCTDCIQNYILDGSTCRSDTSCNDDEDCTSCPNLFVFDSETSTCQACEIEGDDNCEECSASDLSMCTECRRGFYLDDENTCVQCNEGCEICSSSNGCQICNDGFTFTGLDEEDITESTCMACESPCATCKETVTTCLTCVEGFELSGWKCVNDNRVLFVTVLNADFDTITTADIVNIKEAILEAAERTANDDITLERLVSGSVEIQGSVATSDEEDEARVAAALAEAFTVGNTLAGFEVESSSFTAVSDADDEESGDNTTGGQVPGGNNSTEDDDDSNLGLILGLSIPLGIIALALIVFGIYKCASSKGHHNRNNPEDGFESNNVLSSDKHKTSV